VCLYETSSVSAGKYQFLIFFTLLTIIYLCILSWFLVPATWIPYKFFTSLWHVVIVIYWNYIYVIHYGIIIFCSVSWKVVSWIPFYKINLVLFILFRTPTTIFTILYQGVKSYRNTWITFKRIRTKIRDQSISRVISIIELTIEKENALYHLVYLFIIRKWFYLFLFCWERLVYLIIRYHSLKMLY